MTSCRTYTASWLCLCVQELTKTLTAAVTSPGSAEVKKSPSVAVASLASPVAMVKSPSSKVSKALGTSQAS